MRRARRLRDFPVWLPCLLLLAGCAQAPPQPPAIDAPVYRGADAPARTDDARLHADVMALDDEIRQLLDRRVDATDDRLRLRQLIALFQSDQQLGLRYNASVTFDAIETFRRREGNCLSLSILFAAAARHVGLDARFQDVELLPTWRQEGDVFVVERHINVAVMIRDRPVVVDFLVQPSTETVAIRQIADDAMRAQFFNNVGVEHLTLGDSGAAYLFFRRAIDTAPRISWLWTNLGVALSRAGQHDDARAAYRHALRLDQADEVALSNLAALSGNGEPDDALPDEVSAALLVRVERLRNSNPFYHYWQSERLRAAGDRSGAIRALRAAIALKADEASFHFALARLLFLSGERAEADRSFDTARGLARDDDTRRRYEAEYRALLAATVSARTLR